MNSVPPLNDLSKMAGLNLPTYLKGEELKDAGINKEEKKVFYQGNRKKIPKLNRMILPKN